MIQPMRLSVRKARKPVSLDDQLDPDGNVRVTDTYNLDQQTPIIPTWYTCREGGLAAAKGRDDNRSPKLIALGRVISCR